MRGITLEEIAEATKIGTRSLRALEEEEFDKLPGGIFNKGFVRAYSRYLGIDEEQAVADYMTAVGDTQPGGRALKPELVTGAAPEKNLWNIDDDEEPRLPQIAWGALAVLVILVAAGFAGARYVSRHGWPQLRRAQAASAQPRTTAAPVPVTPPSATAAAQAPPAVPPATKKAASANTVAPGTAAETSAATPAQDGFLLRVRAKQDTWVLLIVDGKQEMSGTLAADAEKAVRAQRRVVFKTGNAAAIELFQDGKPLPLLGEEKQVRQVTITPQGIQEAKRSE